MDFGYPKQEKISALSSSGVTHSGVSEVKNSYRSGILTGQIPQSSMVFFILRAQNISLFLVLHFELSLNVYDFSHLLSQELHNSIHESHRNRPELTNDVTKFMDHNQSFNAHHQIYDHEMSQQHNNNTQVEFAFDIQRLACSSCWFSLVLMSLCSLLELL